MNTVTSRLSRWVAGFIAVALISGGSLIATTPASAAPATITGGSLDWGIAADYRAVFATRGVAGGATQTAADTFSFPAATTSTYDPARKSGTLAFTGNARIGYMAGFPQTPGVVAGNYFYLSNPVVTINGSTGTLSGVTAGDSHKTNPELPTAMQAVRTVANLDFSAVTPTVNAEGTLITFTAVPATITEAGTSVLATFVSATDSAAGKRVAGSALDPVTIQLAVAAPVAPAVATTTTVMAPATATLNSAVPLSARVTPAGAAGSVEFFDGATSLATAPVASGTASTSVTFAAAGAHPITAVFTPTDLAAFTASTSAASTVTVNATPVVTTPTLSVSKTNGLNPAGETVTVTGSNYEATAANKYGAGNAGFYAQIGWLDSSWRPSAGAASSARSNAYSAWVKESAPSVPYLAWTDNGDGTANFSWTVTIDKATLDAKSRAGATLAVFTVGAGGVTQAANEAAVPITFQGSPSLSVSKTTGINPAGESVTVTGTNYQATAANLYGAGKAGFYAQVGWIDSTWRPSAGAVSANRSNAYSAWVKESAPTAPYLAWTDNGDGTADFSWTVTITKATLDAKTRAGATLAVFTIGAGGVVQSANELAVPITFATAPAATSLSLTAAPSTVTAGAATALTAKVAPVAAGTVTFTSGGATVGVVPVTADGTATQVTPPLAAGTTSYTATFAPTDPLAFAGSAVTVSVTATAPAPSTASLDWGVKKSFRDYIVSPIANGTITTNGVTDIGGVYSFPSASGGSYDASTGIGSVLYTGSVHFTGHAGVLDIDFSNPSIRVASATAGTLSVSVDGGDPVVIANLDLGSATTSSTATSTSFAGAPATVTAAGATAFGGFYSAGTSLDPVSFTIDTTVPADPNAPTEPENPVPPIVVPPALAPVATPASLAAGSLTWGVKQSFRDYVTGSIAKGAVTTSGVASSGSSYTFGQAAGGTFDRASGVGSSNYSGSVRFTGHAGLLDITLGNPVVRVDSAASGTLLVSVNGGASTPFATLDLAAGSRSTPGNAVSYSGVPASLTSQGAAVFSLNGSGFYSTGTPLDAVSFVIGAPNVVSNTVGATVASFKAPNTAAPTPPATTGIEVAQGTTLTAGDEVTITAGGFRPNETGILVVIYSTPAVLDTSATADARGVVTWTGRLPAGLSGVHTLTLQGSVDRGVELTIAAAELAATVAGCVVDDATLTWGFKESFRAYISGSIANGEWTVADGATYAVPDFGFSAGTGGYDAESGEGLLAFAGSIAFTGHSGVLNTTVANPQIRFVDESSALLLLDVSGTTQDGAVVDNKAVEFAELDLTGVLENDGGAVTITAAPAILTDAGAAAFGTYPAGEALDPVTIAFTTAADCAVPVEEAAPAATTADVDTVSDENPIDYGWVVWLIAALLVIAAAVVVVVVLRRRKA
ncbi:HtaA domain-containing protein [Conyzicola sp.]|uniref:HtaA domain-containing protein n=1 Tax=Conyzicola sp. TaxID=1969404 RepID=UPI0039898910